MGAETSLLAGRSYVRRSRGSRSRAMAARCAEWLLICECMVDGIGMVIPTSDELRFRARSLPP